MIRDLFGPKGISSELRRGLDEAMATHRAVADRIARANTQSANSDFNEALQTSEARLDEQELTRNMTLLADTELRYQTEARLLSGVYASIRKAIGRNA